MKSIKYLATGAAAVLLSLASLSVYAYGGNFSYYANLYISGGVSPLVAGYCASTFAYYDLPRCKRLDASVR